MAHTPLKDEMWSFDTCARAFHGAYDDPDAEFIVKAVNCHQELVDALKASIANHCPNDAFFCGTCSPARKLLARVDSL